MGKELERQLLDVKKRRQLGLIRGSDVLTKVERSIVIKAPPGKVWEMLAFDRMPEWNEGSVENVEYTSEVHL